MPPVMKMERTDFAAAVEAASKELVSVDHRRDGSFIRLPMIYPSGAHVIVRVDEASQNEYFVSDYGMGYSESDMIGATHLYRRHAAQIANHSGISFDGNAFFVVRVSKDQIAGAAATVGNCSLEAVSIAALRLSERKFKDESALLHDRLVSIFTEKLVSKDVGILGASQTEWHVSNVVKVPVQSGEIHTTIFEPVTKHHASIAAAVTKFHDIARLDNPPGRVVVVRRKDDFGTYLSVLSQAADVIARDVPDSTLRRLAA